MAISRFIHRYGPSPDFCHCTTNLRSITTNPASTEETAEHEQPSTLNKGKGKARAVEPGGYDFADVHIAAHQRGYADKSLYALRFLYQRRTKRRRRMMTTRRTKRTTTTLTMTRYVTGRRLSATCDVKI